MAYVDLDQRRETQRRYREQHREQRRAYCRKYAQEHPDRYLKIKQRLDERNAKNIHPVELTQTSIEERHKQWKDLGAIGERFLQRIAERKRQAERIR